MTPISDVFTPAERSRVMAAVGSRNTAPEIAVRRNLTLRGLRYRLHRKDLPGRPDIVLPGRGLLIFVNGCFWHGHDCGRGTIPASNRRFWRSKLARNVQRDHEQQTRLAALGWKVAVVWECQTRNPRTLDSVVEHTLNL